MNKEEIEENFRDITAGIHKLRMDSNAELSPLEMKDVCTSNLSDRCLI